MSAPLVILDSEVSVADACKLMGEKHVGSVLLSRREVVQAIFTERDLVSRVLPQQGDLSSVTVGTHASSPIVTVTPETDVKEAAHIMTELRVRHLVVIQDDKLIGIFTASDLAKAVGKLPLEL
jgi:CBS domain-containing protein